MKSLFNTLFCLLIFVSSIKSSDNTDFYSTFSITSSDPYTTTSSIFAPMTVVYGVCTVALPISITATVTFPQNFVWPIPTARTVLGPCDDPASTQSCTIVVPAHLPTMTLPPQLSNLPADFVWPLKTLSNCFPWVVTETINTAPTSIQTVSIPTTITNTSISTATVTSTTLTTQMRCSISTITEPTTTTSISISTASTTQTSISTLTLSSTTTSISTSTTTTPTTLTETSTELSTSTATRMTLSTLTTTSVLTQTQTTTQSVTFLSTILITTTVTS